MIVLLSDLYSVMFSRARERVDKKNKSDKNFTRASSIFLAFMFYCDISLYHLSYTDLIVYIEYLDTFYTPATVPVYFSHAKTFIELANYPSLVFSHRAVKRYLYEVSKNKQYVPNPTQPLNMSQFNTVLYCIQHDHMRVTYMFAFSLLLVCAWRRSNIAPDTESSYDPTRHPSRQDFVLSPTKLEIRQKWAKNLQQTGQHHTIVIEARPRNAFCLVDMYGRMLMQTPTVNPQQPLLVYPHTYRPITTGHLAKVWSAAVQAAGLPPHVHTLHCIRKTAADLVAKLGATQSQIMDFGLWNSGAYKRYIRTNRASKLHASVMSHIAKI